LPLLARAQCDRIFQYPFPERYFQIDTFFIGTESDTASIRLIEACQAEAKDRKDLNSQLFLELHKYIVLINTGTGYTVLSNMLDSLLAEAEPTQDPYLLASIYMRRAWLHLDQKNYPKVFEDYLRTYEFLKSIDAKTFPGKNYQLYIIALSFYQFNDYEKAIEIGKQVDAAHNVPWQNTLNANLLGMCYLKQAAYDSARYWFSDALKTVPLSKMGPGWEGLINGNIGNSWYYQNEYDKAIPFLLSGVEKTTAEKIWDNAAGFNCALADIYLRQGDIQKAWIYLQQATEAAQKAGDDDNFFKLYSTLSQYYRQSGNTRLALMYQDSMLIHKAKIESVRDTRLKIQAEYKIENEKRNAESNRLKAETTHQKRIRNYVIGILFLLMVLVLLYFNRQRLKYAFKEQQLENEKRKTEKELATAQLQLDDFTQNLKDKNNLIEKFSEEIQKLQESPSHALKSEDIENLNQLRLSAILTDAHWEEFRGRFEKVHGGYLQRLKIKLPDLSPAETRFMALAKLQLNNKEMASILGISPDSIRMMRHRLRKKLSLEEEGSLEELINTV